MQAAASARSPSTFARAMPILDSSMAAPSSRLTTASVSAVSARSATRSSTLIWEIRSSRQRSFDEVVLVPRVVDPAQHLGERAAEPCKSSSPPGRAPARRPGRARARGGRARSRRRPGGRGGARSAGSGRSASRSRATAGSSSDYILRCRTRAARKFPAASFTERAPQEGQRRVRSTSVRLGFDGGPGRSPRRQSDAPQDGAAGHDERRGEEPEAEPRDEHPGRRPRRSRAAMPASAAPPTAVVSTHGR